MLKFIRTVDKSFEDYLVFNLKALGNLIDNVDNHSPDTFRYGKFRRVFGHFTKKSSNSFVGREASCCSKYVILHDSNSGTSNLGSKVAHLILSESKVPFTILENDLQRPTHMAIRRLIISIMSVILLSSYSLIRFAVWLSALRSLENRASNCFCFRL